MFKKHLAFLAMLFVFAISASTVFAADKISGDADGDGQISATDAAIVFNHIQNNGSYEGFEYMDVNEDYLIDENDVNLIMEKALNDDFIFPITEKTINISGYKENNDLFINDTLKAETNAKYIDKFVWEIGDKATTDSGIEFIADENKVTVETTDAELPLKAEYNAKYVMVKAVLKDGNEISSLVTGPLSVLQKIEVVDETTSSGAIYVGDTLINNDSFDTSVEFMWYVKDTEDGEAVKLDKENSNSLFLDFDLADKFVQLFVYNNGVKFAASTPIKVTVKNINIYATHGSLPTLYALLNAYADESESYMWYERATTVPDTSALPSHIKLMTPLGSDPFNLQKRMDEVGEIIKANPYAHFNLYCDDIRAQYEIQLLVYNGLSRDRYNVYLVSDGTGTYTWFDSYFKDSTAATENWDKYVAEYNTAIENAKNGIISDNLYKENTAGLLYCFVSPTLNDNVEHWVQYKDILVSNNSEINSKLNFVEKKPYDMYNALSDEKKAEFLSVMGADKATCDEKYFPNNGKKYIVILGAAANENGEGRVDGTFEDAMDQVLQDYGDDYVFYYKPHPVWPASKVEGREDYLKSRGIVELPAQLPMEVLMWAYPEVGIGGYTSTTYLSAFKGNVKFFFANKKEDLLNVVTTLLDEGLLGDNIEFYPKKMSVDVVVTGSAIEVEGVKDAISVDFVTNTDGTEKSETPISKTETAVNQTTYVLIKKDYSVNVGFPYEDKYEFIVDKDLDNNKITITVNSRR